MKPKATDQVMAKTFATTPCRSLISFSLEGRRTFRMALTICALGKEEGPAVWFLNTNEVLAGGSSPCSTEILE